MREATAPIIPSRDLESPFDHDFRKTFTDLEKTDPFFNLFKGKRGSDENVLN